MPLYSDKARLTSPRQRSPQESIYEFCDRLDRPQIGAGRDLTNQWLEQIPAMHRPELHARLRSRKDHDHLSALLELYLFARFVDFGFNPEFVRPSIGSTPDVFITVPSGARAAVEASIVCPSQEEQQRDRQLSAFYQATARKTLDPRIRARFEVVELKGNPPAHPFASHLDSIVKRAGDRLRAGELTSCEAPFYWKHASTGTILKGHIVLSARSQRGESVHLSGPSEAYWGTGAPSLHDRLRQKRKQHSSNASQNLPILIAISWNDFKWNLDDDEVLNCVTEERAAMLWVSPCYPWSLDKMRMSLIVSKRSSTHSLYRDWPVPITTVE